MKIAVKLLSSLKELDTTVSMPDFLKLLSPGLEDSCRSFEAFLIVSTTDLDCVMLPADKSSEKPTPDISESSLVPGIPVFKLEFVTSFSFGE